MGLFCANFHFREADEEALNVALKRRGVAGYRVLPSKGGWTSLYEERASRQDDEWIRKLTGELAKEMNVAALAFMVHDSDIACYWLFDKDKLIDEYNSFPDYFDMDGGDDEPSGPHGGRPDLLARYCRTGVRESELAAILAMQATFAESVIERLAEALGIDPDRALGDYRHADDDEGPEGFGGFGDDDGPGGFDGDDDGEDRGGPSLKLSGLRKGLAGRFSQMFGLGSQGAKADPQATALVEAAASDDVEAIGRLLASGVAVDVEAPGPLPIGQPMAGLGQILAGRVPKIAMTPLLAAVVNKRQRAAVKLLDGGADPNRVHQLYGTAMHAAAGGGDAELLQLLIDRGGDVNARNAQRQTALEALTTSRATLDRLVQAQAMMKSMGQQMPELLNQLSGVTLPKEGWDRCEQLLKAAGAR